MSKPIAPCKDCEERCLKCHTTCKRYLDYIDNKDEYKNRIANAKKKDAETKSYIHSIKVRKHM